MQVNSFNDSGTFTVRAKAGYIFLHSASHASAMNTLNTLKTALPHMELEVVSEKTGTIVAATHGKGGS